jgi:hypothetical protein
VDDGGELSLDSSFALDSRVDPSSQADSSSGAAGSFGYDLLGTAPTEADDGLLRLQVLLLSVTDVDTYSLRGASEAASVYLLFMLLST